MDRNVISYNKIIPLRNICRVIAKIKSQQIESLPHFGHEALFFHNNAVTTGLMNNTSELKIDLFSGLLLSYNNEDTIQIDLISKNIQDINDFFTNNFGLSISQEITNLDSQELQNYYYFVSKANLSLEIFRMGLTGKFTLVHLWPHGFDLSVEWFTGFEDQQIGIGISPGEENISLPYLYINPYPFNQKIKDEKLPLGEWHDKSWKGIKVEWNEISSKNEKEIASVISRLFKITCKNFTK
ncbi:MAG: hypothetical protein ACM3XP_03870 [Nitrososphaerales archaeon]